MVHVEEIDLNLYGLTFPSSLVGIVALQPHLALTPEPFHCEPAYKVAQLAAIQRTLIIAQHPDHGAAKTHFTLFPEYSIPGLQGVNEIEAKLREAEWPVGTVIIGGTDALTRDEYATLCTTAGTTVSAHHAHAQVNIGEWVNCGITWIKTPDGRLLRWLQPKIAPAWPEQNIQHGRMFCGNAVFLFKCKFDNNSPCSFLSLICYDWIGTVDTELIPKQVLAGINQQAQQRSDNVSLSWLIVIQHNASPSHRNFLNAATDLLEHPAQSPSVRRDRTCILFANTAGRETPGTSVTHGHSSLVFSPLAPFDLSGCHPTYCGNPKHLRNSDALDRCRDVLFRERGACIHSFSQYVPDFVDLSAGGRTLPIQQANIHGIADLSTDPRTPGGPVSACVKWVNDSLDQLPAFSPAHPKASVVQAMLISHETNIGIIRRVPSSELEKRVSDARYQKDEKSKTTADDWGENESNALKHVIYTLDILRLCFPELNASASPVHATFVVGDQIVDVLAVDGPSHEACFAHGSYRVQPLARHQLMIVSRDIENSPLLKKSGKFTTPVQSQVQSKTRITNVDSVVIHIAYVQLMSTYLRGQTIRKVETLLHASLIS